MELEDVPNLPTANDSLGLLQSTFEVLGGVTCCETDDDCGSRGRALMAFVSRKKRLHSCAASTGRGISDVP